jgi:hypothetical protein
MAKQIKKKFKYYSLGNVLICSYIDLFHPFHEVLESSQEPELIIADEKSYEGKTNCIDNILICSREITDIFSSYSFLFDQIVPFLFRKKKVIFHGSVVLKNQQALCFIGNHGAGKTTAALSLLSSGYLLIADSMFVYDFSDMSVAIPSWPERNLLLFPDSASRVLSSECQFMLNFKDGKGLYKIKCPISVKSAPLSDLYLLKAGSRNVLIDQIRTETLIDIIHNIMGGIDLLTNDSAALLSYLEQLFSLAKIKILTRNVDDLSFSISDYIV